jgi:hypothetical protein
MKHELNCKADINTCRICFQINSLLEMHAEDCKKRGGSCVCPIWRCHEIRSGNSSRKALPSFLNPFSENKSRLIPLMEPAIEENTDTSVVETPFFPCMLPDSYVSALGPKKSSLFEEMIPFYTSFSSDFQLSNMSDKKDMLQPTSFRPIVAADRVCVVCEKRQRKIILFPCNHLCLCAECNHDLEFKCAISFRCPVCSAIVQSRQDTVTMHSWV